MRRVEPVRTVEPDVVRLYVCGISASGPPHVGHGRSYVVFDVLRRMLEHAGYRVAHVQNFTDIEESITKRARAARIAPAEHASRMIGAYFEAMDRLDVQRAHHYPRVTQFMDRIIAATSLLQEHECGYKIPDGVAFRSCDVEDFGGLLGGDPVERVVHEVGEQAWGGRENPFDFIVWRNRDDIGETWRTAWGEGRPGWHTECAVMATHLLGNTIDIHGGGMDLVFPHHECERAIAKCLTGQDLCHHWVHNGLVTADRTKMSKSLGNSIALGDALDEHGPACVRVEYLMAPYRDTLDWRKQTLDAAHRWVVSVEKGLGAAQHGKPAGAVATLRDAMVGALRNDLDTPKALSVLRQLATDHAREPGAAPVLREGLALLGLARLEPFGAPSEGGGT